MNRSDILKKCVDRGVAGETEVGAVSHLFYVYLLSALQRGQRVEVPSFGTFGTRVAGVKRTRKIPYFEPEQDLARKVNQRFENLKTVVTGKYVVTPQPGEAEYKGAEPPFDQTIERGKEFVFDTSREVSVDEYERAGADATETSQPEEERVMPRLNLRDEEEAPREPEEQPPIEPPMEPVQEEEFPVTPPPTLRDVGPERERRFPWLAAALILLLLAVAVFSLNYFNVIHLWGKRAPTVAEQLPEPALPEPAPGEESVTPPAAGEDTTPLPTVPPGARETARPPAAGKPGAEKPAAGQPAKPSQAVTPRPSTSGLPAGTGRYTVQVSSWKSGAKANRLARELGLAGFDAYVVDVEVEGEQWHRVRVGRFGTKAEAQDAITKLEREIPDGLWVDMIE